MSTPLADALARTRIATDLDTTFVVEAAAGTGKTTALVGRIVGVLRAGKSTLDRMVCVTFTEKAAGEMKLRLRAELEKAFDVAREDEERRRLEGALAALELAHINTIHGFCADLLRERPLDAGVDPAFRVLDEAGSSRLVNQAFDAWFEHTLADPPESIRRVLRRRSWRAERQTPRAQLRHACVNLVEHRDFRARWQRPSFDRTASVDELLLRFRRLGALAAQASNARDPLAKALRVFRDFVERIDERERVRARDYEELEAELTLFPRQHERAFTDKGRGRLFGESLDRSAVLEERDATQKALEAFLRDVEADLAAALQEDLWPVVERFELLKGKQGALDFVDLLLSARDLLTRDAHARALLQERFTHIFVDEFQDTDPLQAELLLLLAASDAKESDYRAVRVKPGKLFIVGDPKQSIYRFRRADVAFYEKVKRTLLERGAELLHLTTNFRSLPAIQAAVNAAFSRAMQGAPDGSQAEYVALTPHRTASGAQPEVIALPVPAPYSSQGNITLAAVGASYAQAVGAFLKWLLDESGWRVKEGNQSVPVAARHVCLLFRRFQSFREDLTHPYVRALEERSIAHVLVGGRSFHGREEVVALSSALEAIEWPDDELSVYATLHGPLLGITDEELLRFRAEHGRLSALRRFEAPVREAHPAVTDGLRLIRELHFRRNRRPIADTVEELLAETRAHAALALWRSGEQVLANALSLIETAHGVEASGATSFRAFLDALAEQAEEGGRSEAPIIEEGTEGVRLMTVHKAKGLEFPVVVLCDPTAPKDAKRGTRFVDLERQLWAEPLAGCRPIELIHNEALVRQHEEAENVRLAYVAATRASDLLVVPAFGDAGERGANVGWTDLLAPALYPPQRARALSAPAPGCPRFREDSVRERPAAVQARPDECVRPGLHTALAGNPVVWWDPHLLELVVDYPGGVRQQDLLKESSASDAGIRAHAEWLEKRRRTLEESSAVSVPRAPITGLAQGAPSSTPPRIERTAVSQARHRGRSALTPKPHATGPRFGTLVHELLAEAPLDATEQSLNALATSLARLLGATAEEQQAAVASVLAALSHPLLLRAKSALEVRREVPVVRRLPDGILAEGVIDLAFREAEGWTIVDYKTDAPESLEDYAAQLEHYVEAVRAAVDAPVRGTLLLV